MQQFFYDEQIRRFLLQFTRIFSNFQVEYGKDDNGNSGLLRVPVRYGDVSRQAQTIIQQNSANEMPSAPMITFYVASMDYDRPRMQEPYHVDKLQVRQRFYDQDSETYETTQGNAFSIERLMPVPYKMTLNVDIWTTNTNQKLQLFEQIATLFNPALEIQSTDNYVDWTSLSTVELVSTAWTSRTVPIGTDNPIDIMTLRFELPIWISSPAKVKKLGVVEKIIYSVYDANGDVNEALFDSDLLLGTRQKFTPYNYKTLLIGNKVQALKYSAVVDESNESIDLPETPPSNEHWPAIIGMYGNLRPGISQIKFDSQWGDDTQVVGTVSVDPTDDRFLLVDIDSDTTPQNTLSPVNAVIDPLVSGPGEGLAEAAEGQRYLILQDIGSDDTASWPPAWGKINARANDIIEYINGFWSVDFDSSEITDIEFVTNLTSNIQYRWTGSEWVKSYEGLYPSGEWSIVL